MRLTSNVPLRSPPRFAGAQGGGAASDSAIASTLKPIQLFSPVGGTTHPSGPSGPRLRLVLRGGIARLWGPQTVLQDHWADGCSPSNLCAEEAEPVGCTPLPCSLGVACASALELG